MESSDLLEKVKHHWACSVQYLWRCEAKGKNLAISNAKKLQMDTDNLDGRILRSYLNSLEGSKLGIFLSQIMISYKIKEWYHSQEKSIIA